MAELVAAFPKIHCTFNFIPSLLGGSCDTQNELHDEWELLSFKESWTADEKQFLRAILSIHPRLSSAIPYVRAIPRAGCRSIFRDLAAPGSTGWIDPGSSATRRSSSGIKETTREDIGAIIAKHRRLPRVIPFHRRLARTDEISVSPCHHPSAAPRRPTVAEMPCYNYQLLSSGRCRGATPARRERHHQIVWRAANAWPRSSVSGAAGADPIISPGLRPIRRFALTRHCHQAMAMVASRIARALPTNPQGKLALVFTDKFLPIDVFQLSWRSARGPTIVNRPRHSRQLGDDERLSRPDRYGW
jgi:hypothetical protein